MHGMIEDCKPVQFSGIFWLQRHMPDSIWSFHWHKACLWQPPKLHKALQSHIGMLRWLKRVFSCLEVLVKPSIIFLIWSGWPLHFPHLYFQSIIEAFRHASPSFHYFRLNVCIVCLEILKISRLLINLSCPGNKSRKLQVKKSRFVACHF